MADKAFTQEEVNTIIQDRLAKEKAKFDKQISDMQESQLLTIAGIIGNNLEMFLNEQLEQIDLFYSSENGLSGEKMQMDRKISYFLDKNEKLYNWIRLICPDGRQILYKAGTEPFYEAAEAEHTPAGHATNAQITGKKISEETGWYEMYIVSKGWESSVKGIVEFTIQRSP